MDPASSPRYANLLFQGGGAADQDPEALADATREGGWNIFRANDANPVFLLGNPDWLTLRPLLLAPLPLLLAATGARGPNFAIAVAAPAAEAAELRWFWPDIGKLLRTAKPSSSG